MRNRNNNSGGGRPSRNTGSAKGNFKTGGPSAGGGFGARKAKPATESRFSKPSIKKSSLRIVAAQESQAKKEVFKKRDDFDLSAEQARSLDKGAGRPFGFQGKKDGARAFDGGKSFKPEFKKDFKSGKPERSDFRAPGARKPWGERDAKPSFKREAGAGKPDFSADRPARNPDLKRKDADAQAEGPARRVGRFERAPRYNFEEFEERAAKKKGNAGEDKEFIRLNRYIANSGICSRREADDLILSGQITVNGKPVVEMGYKVKPSDTVKYGKKALNPERMIYILVNKPKDYITTTEDPEDRKKVIDLIDGACTERVYPVGRLDRNTTGLLLMTNDGELAEKLTHPSSGIKKIYQAELDRPITTEDFEILKKGVELEDGFIRPDDLGIVTPDAMVVGLEIHSGRNRIVRRMFEHLGYEVKKLDRTTFAGLNKKDLPRGKWRFLSEKEVIRLKFLI
jgi:23S rRNA pseudouridine2605 synthase